MINDRHARNAIFSFPEFSSLPIEWKIWFNEIDYSLQENFWGNLSIFRQADQKNDPYIRQQKEIGFSFKKNEEAPASFYDSIRWIFSQLRQLVQEKRLSPDELILPARAFEVSDKTGTKKTIFRIIGEPVPANSVAVELVKPDMFVAMLSQGYYPVGGAIREHTNQTLAEHDLAHLAGFISNQDYMRTVREGFRRVREKMRHNPALGNALKDYNSVYSLRIYYMTEIFTVIPEQNKPKLKKLLHMDLNQPANLNHIIGFLERKAEHPADLYCYLHNIYEHFNEIVNPLGGESRDILNRTRKFNRKSRLGDFYSDLADQRSKFDGSSIYSLHLNGYAALESKRSTHPDFMRSLREIHAPLIGSLIGTSQLSVEDWVLQSVEEYPDPHSKLYQYLCRTGMWNTRHLIYLAHSIKDYTHILPAGTYVRNTTQKGTI